MKITLLAGLLCYILAEGQPSFATALDSSETAIALPPVTTFADDLRMTHAMLSERRTPLWVSDHDGSEANCGGLDLFEVAQAATENGSVAVTPEMLGSARFRLRVGERLHLQFRSAENRSRYIALFNAGQAVPAYACWCAYGLAHPKAPHLAAPNNAVVTLRRDTRGRSGLFFNLRERAASWSANPDACIRKSELEVAKVIQTLDAETKRPFDRVFDRPPGSRPLPTQECTGDTSVDVAGSAASRH